MCFDWRVLAGLVAVGVGIAVFAPQLLSLKTLLLLAVLACPLSMLLMVIMMGNMGSMGGEAAGSTRNPMKGTTVNPAPSRQEQLARLREQLLSLQDQQEAVANQINALEQDER